MFREGGEVWFLLPEGSKISKVNSACGWNRVWSSVREQLDDHQNIWRTDASMKI